MLYALGWKRTRQLLMAAFSFARCGGRNGEEIARERRATTGPAVSHSRVAREEPNRKTGLKLYGALLTHQSESSLVASRESRGPSRVRRFHSADKSGALSPAR